MERTFLCQHCGSPARRYFGPTHPFRHVATGQAGCIPTTKATPPPEWQDTLGR